MLYRVVADQLETFLKEREERDRPVPKFVEREFRTFLDCGVLARGFLRVRCQSCGHDRLVGFSCKGRVWCPSCGGRRMADTAAHLVDRVFPIVPVRQWVLSLPFALRYRMAYDAGLTSDVLGVFIRTLFGELRRRAHNQLAGRSSQCGAVTFVQRFGDALNANVHFHCLAIDGVYAAAGDGRPQFHELPAPEDADVLRLTTLVSKKTRSLLERRGLLAPEADTEHADPLSEEDPGMAALLAYSVGRRVAVGSNTGRRLIRLGDFIDAGEDAFDGARCAMVSGFSVHANVGIRARDRARLERLARYAARPAVATGRLEELPDGRLLYRLKRPWRDGTSAIVFERQDFIAKLAVLVPAPRAHLTRYHGVFGPAAAWRSLIVPAAAPPPADSSVESTNGRQPPRPSPMAPLPEPEPAPRRANTAHRRNYTWAELMKRVFLVDVLQCEHCGGQMKIIAAVHSPHAARRILECLGLPSRAPPLAPAVTGSTACIDSI